MAKDPNEMTAAELAATLTAEEQASAAPADTPPGASAGVAKVAKGGGAGGSLASAKVGERVKKGAPAIAEADLGAQVVVRITKAGDQQVHDGQGGVYDWNDEVVLPRDVALDVQKRQLAEIVGTA